MPAMPARSSDSALATVTISARGTLRLRSGHVWVYRSDILSADGIAPGALVKVSDPQGKSLGTALYSTASQIAIRLLSRGRVEDFPALLRQRIQEALGYRDLVVRDTDAYRIVFSEADFLPGLIVDRYNDIVAFQVLTQAMDSEAARQALVFRSPSACFPEVVSKIFQLFFARESRKRWVIETLWSETPTPTASCSARPTSFRA